MLYLSISCKRHLIISIYEDICISYIAVARIVCHISLMLLLHSVSVIPRKLKNVLSKRKRKK